mmetsp:Transcript_45374/g.92703  ORF Transcript_45374/g.92703 Transcript_45374/m.92703 type:complete len:234 (+) Transcript_45374:793-1494(+)
MPFASAVFALSDAVFSFGNPSSFHCFHSRSLPIFPSTNSMSRLNLSVLPITPTKSSTGQLPFVVTNRSCGSQCIAISLVSSFEGSIAHSSNGIAFPLMNPGRSAMLHALTALAKGCRTKENRKKSLCSSSALWHPISLKSSSLPLHRSFPGFPSSHSPSRKNSCTDEPADLGTCTKMNRWLTDTAQCPTKSNCVFGVFSGQPLAESVPIKGVFPVPGAVTHSRMTHFLSDLAS